MILQSFNNLKDQYIHLLAPMVNNYFYDYDNSASFNIRNYLPFNKTKIIFSRIYLLLETTKNTNYSINEQMLAFRISKTIINIQYSI